MKPRITAEELAPSTEWDAELRHRPAPRRADDLMRTLRTPARPDLLVGRWVRLDRDGHRPPRLGVLTRATPDPDHPGLWQWALRTPTGYMVGGPHLPAETLTRKHAADVARARRALTRQLRADRSVLADLIAHGEPAAAMARAVADLEDLQASLAAQLAP